MYFAFRRLRRYPYAVVSSAALAAGAQACDSRTEALSREAASHRAPAAATSAGTRRVGELATQPDYSMSVESVRDCPSARGLGPQPGDRRLGVEVVIEGRSARQVPATAFYARIVDASDEQYESLLMGCSPLLDPTLVTRGQTARGWVTFEVPKSARKLHLVYSPPIIDSGSQISRFALER